MNLRIPIYSKTVSISVVMFYIRVETGKARSHGNDRPCLMMAGIPL